MITETQPKAAKRGVAASAFKAIEWKDDGDRRAGRLACVMRAMAARVSCE